MVRARIAGESLMKKLMAVGSGAPRLQLKVVVQKTREGRPIRHPARAKDLRTAATVRVG